MRPRAPLFPFATGTMPAPAPETDYTKNPGEVEGSDSDDAKSTTDKGDSKPLPASPEGRPTAAPTLSPPPMPVAPAGAATGGGAAADTDTNTLLESLPVEPKAMNHHDSMCFLKIIGSIRNGQKLRHSSTNPNQPISIDPNQWSSSISRWWNGDSRTQSVQVLRDRFNQVFKNIDEAYEEHNKTASGLGGVKNAFHRSPKDVLLDYARELTGAEKGLHHLCHTYKSDIPIASELQVMLESVTIRKQTIDGMFTIKNT